MSSASPASVSSSPKSLVRSAEAPQDQHASATASSAEPEAITFVKDAPPELSQAVRQPDDDLQHQPQYEPEINGRKGNQHGSSASTPRLPPAKAGKHDLEESPSDTQRKIRPHQRATMLHSDQCYRVEIRTRRSYLTDSRQSVRRIQCKTAFQETAMLQTT